MNVEKVIGEVVKNYHEAMAYTLIPRPKIILSFSAVPGSGKTTLARKLKDDLKACYIHADAIRNILREEGIDPRTLKISDITAEIARLVFKNDANKFIILDASIDRTWAQFFKNVKSEDARPFTIRLNVPDEIVAQRQINRDGEAKSLAERARFREQFDIGKRQFKADIELMSNYDYDEVLREVREKLGLVATE